LSQLEIDVIAPDGTRVPLIQHGAGVVGANLGGPDGYNLSTIFDDSASRSIYDTAFTAPFIGRFGTWAPPPVGPDTTSPPSAFGPGLKQFNGISRDKVNGTWTLVITDFSNSGNPVKVQHLKDWGLDINSGLSTGKQSLVATTFVTGALTGEKIPGVATSGPYGISPAAPPPNFTAVTPIGIGPAPSIASDNTLGAFSQFQGRIYAAYTQINPNTAAYSDGTTIQLETSDDGGVTWSAPIQVNDDNGQTDGYSEALNAPGIQIGRPKLEPQVAVDPTTGTVGLSFYDARNDASRARVATYIALSTDGGQTFAPETFVNTPNLVTDAISRQQVVLGPIPDNQSPPVADPYLGNPNTEIVFSYGDHQGLAFSAGHLYPAWSGNENGGPQGFNLLDIRVANVLTASGPRVVNSTMGPVQAETVHDLSGTPITFNNQTAPDGTLMANGFVVTFDRAVDPSTIGSQNLQVTYRDVKTSGFNPGMTIPIVSFTPLQEGNTTQGPTKFLVLFQASSGVGTYSYFVGPSIRDTIRTVAANGSVQTGNLMDQNANGVGGEDPRLGGIIGLAPGDIYAVPRPAPLAPVLFGGAVLTPPPYDHTTQPLIVSGPHIVQTYVPGAQATPDNLVTDSTVSQLAIVFDRDMNPSTLTSASILRMVGPSGVISGPFTITHLASEDPNHERTFLIGFPVQQLSGTYTVTLASTVKSAAGDQLDTNENAGLDVLRGVPSAGSTPITATSSDAKPPVIGSTAGSITTSQITVPDTFIVQNVTVTINLTYTNDPDLDAYLISPDNVSVHLFHAVGSTGTKQNFTNTTFDDTATTPIQNGGPPFFGRFNPLFPLASFNGHPSGGVWKLEIVNTAGGHTGTIDGWSLTLVKPISGTGLGEAVADQATASFRIFTLSPTNALASSTWTPVGPAGIGAKGEGLNAEISGQISAIAVDPADPSGNTVYVGAASGGIWKSTDFLTTSPTGPTYVPLTDFGPTLGLNIGSIAVFARNNDPNQSIIFAATGNGNMLGNGPPGAASRGDSAAQSTRGVGFLRSVDGGATWQLLDSTVNFAPDGTLLPINSTSRDHVFLNTTAYKVAVDPTLTPTNDVIVYAALSDVDANGQPVAGAGRAGGIWRSVDTGKTWQLMRKGQATDVLLDLNSGTGAPGGNVQLIYGAFAGEGVFFSPNRGQTFNIMAGTTGDPLIQDFDGVPPQPVPVLPSPAVYGTSKIGTPNTTVPASPKGRIVLAKPPLVQGDALQNTLYQGWLYAAVISSPTTVTPDNQTVSGGHLDGLYLTKDFGQNWTRVRMPNLALGDHSEPLVPTNDMRNGDFEPTGGETPYGEAPDIVDPTDPNLDNFGMGNWDLSLVVDPNNPNVVYLGGTNQFHASGLIRVDTTGIADPHAFYMSNSDPEGAVPGSTATADAAGGARRTWINDPLKNPKHSAVSLGNPSALPLPVPPNPFNPVNTPYLNLISNPASPFLVGSTIPTTNTIEFNNTGADTKWIPFDQALKPDPFNNDPNDPWSVPTRGLHVALAMTDPQTGKTRLIFGDDNGVYTSVDAGDGTLIGSLGSVTQLNTSNGDVKVVNGSRNGNLQTTQFFYGTSEPSNLAASVSALTGMFFGSSNGNSTPASDPNIINVGQTGYGNLNWSQPNVYRATGGGIGAVQTGPTQSSYGEVYRFLWPSEVDNGVATDFFQRGLTSRTFNLLQTTSGQVDPLTGPVFDVPDPQWPFRMGFNFAVNPINGDQIIISSLAGRVFSTENQGKFWNVIGNPGALDGTNAQALAYGAPDPNGPGGVGNQDSFIYAGTVSGNIFVTFTGGGTQGNTWKNLSVGLDGSPLEAIVTNPTPGSHEAYAVTKDAVYHMVDSSAANASWVNITSNLFGISETLFGDPTQKALRARDLTSIVADWRYLIPDDPTKPNGTTHPMLYVGGDGGVFRSIDGGLTWSLFPSPDPSGLNTTPTPPGDGGGLPNALVTSLNLSLGFINPTTGRPDVSTGPNVLLASTYGRGSFTIRLAPQVFASSTHLDTSVPAPGGSDSGASNSDGITNVIQPFIDGLSAQSAFGQVVTINLIDMTNPSSPVVIGTGTTDSAGRFQVQVNPGVYKNDGSTDGLKTIGIQATDQSGTKGNIAIFHFTLLTTPPTGFSSPVLEHSSDSGTSNTDDVTNVVNPIFDINTADPTWSVELVRKLSSAPNSSYVVVGSRQGPGAVQDPGPVPDGVYSYATQAVDLAGNVSAVSAALTVTIDTTPPLAPGTPVLDPASDSGVKGDNITNVTNPSFDVSPAEATAIVQLFRNGVFVGSRTGPGAINDPGPLSDGTYVYTARQIDLAGNVGTVSLSQSVTIITSAKAPLAPVLEPGSDSGVKGDNITNVTNPIFDVGPAKAGATVQLFRNGVLVGSRTNAGAIQDPGPVKPDGVYNYTADQIDTSGNVSPLSPVLAVTILTVLPAAPSVPVLDTASDSGVKGDNITNVTNPIFDINTAQASATVDLFRNGVLVGSRIGPGQIQDPGPVQPDGVYTYKAQQIDVAGNVGPVSAGLAVTILTVAPAVPPPPVLDPSTDSGVKGDNITNVTSPKFDVTASATSLTVELFRKLSFAPASAYVLVGSFTGGLTGTITDTGPVADGVYSYATQQLDVAANASALSAPLTVTILTALPPAPSTPVLDPASDSGIKGDNITNVTSPVIDVNSAQGNATVKLFRNGTLVGSRLGPGSVQDPGPVQPDGVYTYTAEQIDIAGNVGPLSAGLAVTIITALPPAPAAPVLDPSTDSGTKGDNITDFTSPEFDVTASSTTDTVNLLRKPASAQASAYVLIGSFVGGLTGTITDIGPVATGTYSYATQQVDVAGNTGQIGQAVTITIIVGAPPAPPVPVLDPTSDSGAKGDDITNVTSPIIDVTAASPTNTVQLFRKLASAPASSYVQIGTSVGTGKITDTGPLADGVYNYEARQVDLAANVSAFSAVLTVTIDTTILAPNAPQLEAASDSGVVGDNITNVKSPTFDVAPAETGATVQLLRNGVVVASRVGAGPIQDAGPVQPDGIYVYTDKQIDIAGNVSPLSGSTSVTIVTSAPAPTTPVLDPASDSGTKGDNITNVTNPFFDITGVEAKATLQLLRNGTLINSITTPTGGSLKIQDPGPLANGTYTYTAKQVDIAGNVSPISGSVTVAIQGSPPPEPNTPVLDPNSDSGVKGDSITNVTNPFIDVSNIEAGATLTLFRNGTSVATLFSATGGTVPIQDPGPLTAGTYTYTASQGDAAGNTSPTSGALQITIITGPVTFTPGIPHLQAASDSGASNSDDVTNITNPIFDEAPVEFGMTVQLLRNGVVVASRGGPGPIQDPGPVQPDGVYSYTAREIDIAGNTGPQSAALLVTIDTKTNTPGTPTLDPSTDSGVVGDNITNAASPIIDVPSIEPNSMVQLFRNGALVASLTSSTGGTVPIRDPGPLANGDYLYTAKQIDLAGNVSAISSSVKITIFSTAPAPPASITLDPASDSGIKGDNITNVTNPKFDITGVIGGDTLELLRNGVVVASIPNAFAGADTIQDPGPDMSSVDTYTAEEVDSAGNTSAPTSSDVITIKTSVAAPTTLKLDPSSDSGTPGDNITNVKAPVFDLTGIDSHATVQLFRNGVVIATLADVTGGSTTIQDPGPVQPDGVYTYTANEIDIAANVSPMSTSLAVTIATVPPLKPTISLLPADDSGVVGDSTTNVTQPHLVGITSVGVFVDLLLEPAGTVLTTVTASATDGSYKIAPPSPLSDGKYFFAVQARDGAGNMVTSTAIPITIKTNPPTKPTISLSAGDDSGIKGDGITNVVKPHFVGTTDPGVTVTLVNAANTVLGTVTAANDGSYSVAPSAALTGGTYVLHTVAADVAGNTNASANVTITIVTAIPAPPTLFLLAADDSGVKGDNITNVRTPRMTGATVPGATVQLLDSHGNLLGTAVAAPVTGFFGIQPTSNLPATVDPLFTQVTDVAGNVGAAGPAITLRILATTGDFDADHKADPVTFRPSPSVATWTVLQSTLGLATPTFGVQGDIPFLGDVDGDGRGDLIVFRPSTATWYIYRTSLGVESVQFGAPNLDIPVVGDFDGDGKTDIGVFRPTSDTWYILRSTLGPESFQFGVPGLDTPVPGDYQGIGQTDLAVYRQSTGQWFVQQSNGAMLVQQFGHVGGDIPIQADYFGDGRTDFAVFQPSTATWFMMPSGGGPMSFRQFGAPNLDIPIPLDYDGDGRADIAVYRPTTSQFLILQSSAGPRAQTVGLPNDIPIAAPLIYRSGGLHVMGFVRDNSSVGGYTPPTLNLGSQAMGLATGSSSSSSAKTAVTVGHSLQSRAVHRFVLNQGHEHKKAFDTAANHPRAQHDVALAAALSKLGKMNLRKFHDED
jgi:subtilisin-like proprotein convertase family protein